MTIRTYRLYNTRTRLFLGSRKGVFVSREDDPHVGAWSALGAARRLDRDIVAVPVERGLVKTAIVVLDTICGLLIIAASLGAWWLEKPTMIVMALGCAAWGAMVFVRGLRRAILGIW